MNVIDLLITIIVVTILVTIALGVMTYIAYKLRLSRRPAAQSPPGAGTGGVQPLSGLLRALSDTSRRAGR